MSVNSTHRFLRDYWIFLALFALGVGAVLLNAQTDRKRIEADKLVRIACLSDPQCSDQAAQSKSSLMPTIVASKTGASYFYGDRCQSDCTLMRAGHDWAESSGIIRASSCGSDLDPEYRRGCLLYVRHVEPESDCEDQVIEREYPDEQEYDPRI